MFCLCTTKTSGNCIPQSDNNVYSISTNKNHRIGGEIIGNTLKKPQGFCYNKDQYSAAQLIEFIEGRRKTLKKKNSDLGAVLGMTGQNFGYYLNPQKGNAGFNYLQLIKLFKELEATDEEILRLMKQQ